MLTLKDMNEPGMVTPRTWEARQAEASLVYTEFRHGQGYVERSCLKERDRDKRHTETERKDRDRQRGETRERDRERERETGRETVRERNREREIKEQLDGDR